jgi:zona occludens toxin
MAINAYTGLMGSGKSYEVVENVILPALAAGRRVVTNVANLQVDEINDYLVDKLGADADKLGAIVQVQNDDLTRTDFFPPENPPEGSPPSTVLPGDLVVVDECWRWWAMGAKISAQHMAFFRMHRHFTHPETGVSCDLVLVVQDIGDLDRKLKAVVENLYRMTKHKALGSTSRYRVDVYQGHKVTRVPIRSIQRKYNKDIFPLYQSYSHGSGKGNEVAIDDRNNIFKSPLFRVLLPLLLVFAAFPVYFLYRFFVPKADDPAKQAQAASQTDSKGKPTGHPSAPPGGPVPSPAVPPDDPQWRVVGYYRLGMRHHIVISRGGSFRTLIDPPGFTVHPVRVSGLLNGYTVSNYSGQETTFFNPTEKK